MASPFDDLPPDPVIEHYKKDLDLTLIRENLKRSPEERLRNLIELQRFAEELRRAGREARSMSDYHINIFYSDEDEGYIADIPDLEACSAFGSTPAEALSEVGKAKEAWLAAARSAGKPIPSPRYRPLI